MFEGSNFLNTPFTITAETAETENRRIRSLWRAALNQVFIDAFSKSKKQRNVKVKKVAKAFVSMRNYNFKFMCDLACYDAKMVYDQFKRLERIGYKLGDENKAK
jgi:predicted alpha-1,6-mannanase (GH76 family)